MASHERAARGAAQRAMGHGSALAFIALAVPCYSMLGANPSGLDMAEQVEGLLRPTLSLGLDADYTLAPTERPSARGLDGWMRVAQTVVRLQQVECDDDLLGATEGMVDAADEGDPLAMAALGVMCAEIQPRVSNRATSSPRISLLPRMAGTPSASAALVSVTSRGACTGCSRRRLGSSRMRWRSKGSYMRPTRSRR